MSCATVALNDWPGWLILEPRLSPRRTVITVPGGIVTEVRTGACAVLDCPGDPLVPELLPDIAPALFPLFAEVSEEGLSPEFAWLFASNQNTSQENTQCQTYYTGSHTVPPQAKICQKDAAARNWMG